MQTSSVAMIILLANFHLVSTWKIWFLPFRKSSFPKKIGHFKKIIKKILGKFVSLVQIQLIFPFWGNNSPIFLWKKSGEKTLIWRIFMKNFSQIHQISKVEKIPKSPFFKEKFHWVAKYIEFFFGNFHIWYIAWSWLWLHHKIGNENTVNWWAY
jgi:hypothetical protein